MVSLFETFEQHYSIVTADITAQVGQLTASTTKDRRQLISKIEKLVEDAQEWLEQMDLEVREIEPSKRQRYRTKLDCYRAEFKRLTLEYIKARSVKQHALNYDSADELNDVRISVDQKRSLLDNSEQIERTGRKLEEGYRVALETQEIGNQVLKNLGDQRETIQRSRNRLRETNEDLGQASRLMNSMIMRSIQQKVVLAAVGACFILAICFGIYYSLTK